MTATVQVELGQPRAGCMNDETEGRMHETTTESKRCYVVSETKRQTTHVRTGGLGSGKRRHLGAQSAGDMLGLQLQVGWYTV